MKKAASNTNKVVPIQPRLFRPPFPLEPSSASSPFCPHPSPSPPSLREPQTGTAGGRRAQAEQEEGPGTGSQRLLPPPRRYQRPPGEWVGGAAEMAVIFLPDSENFLLGRCQRTKATPNPTKSGQLFAGILGKIFLQTLKSTRA